MLQFRSHLFHLLPFARVPLALLVLALGAGMPTWHYLQTRTASEQQAARQRQAEALEAVVVERLNEHGQLLRSAAAHLAVDPAPSKDRWADYVDRLELATRAPRVVAFGYARIHVVNPAIGIPDQPTASSRTESVSPVEWWVSGQNSPPDSGTLSSAVMFEAMARARDGGAVAMVPAENPPSSAPGESPTAVFLVPFYQSRQTPATVGARRRSLVGYVVSIETLSGLFTGPTARGSVPPDVTVQAVRAPGNNGDAQTSVLVTVGSSGSRLEPPDVTRSLSVGGTSVAIELRSDRVSGTRVVSDAVAWGLAAATVAALVGLGVVIQRARRDRRAGHVARAIEQDRRTGELDSSRKLLDAVIQAVPVVVSVKDAAGRIILINGEAERFHGKPAAEFLGKTDHDLYPAAQADRIRAQDAEVASREDVMTFEESFTNIDDRANWVIKRKVGVTLPDGQRGIVTCVSDITEFKTSQLEALRARAFLMAIVEAVPHGMFVKDAQHRWILANRAFSMLVAPGGASLIGKTDIDFFSPTETEVAWSQDDLVLAGGVPLVLEQEITFRNGTSMWFEKAKSRVTLEDGSQYVVGVVRDINAIKRANEELQQSEMRWAAVVSTATEGIVVIDADGRIESANEAMHGMFGHEPGTLLGQNIKVIVPDSHRHHHDGYLAAYTTHGIRKVVGIVRQMEGARRDGTLIPIELSVSEFRLGARAMFTGVVRDQTEISRQRDIAQQTERLARVGGWEVEVGSNKVYWTDETYGCSAKPTRIRVGSETFAT